MTKLLCSLLFLSLLASYFSSSYLLNRSANGALTVAIEATVGIKNSTGRELHSLNVSYFLPLESTVEEKDRIVTIGDDNTILTKFAPVNLYSGEEFQLRDRMRLSFKAATNGDGRRLKNAVEVIPGLGNQLSSFGYHDYAKIINSLDVNGQFFRMVSGILNLPDVAQVPKCWIQYKAKEADDWISVSPENVSVIPFKVIPYTSDIADELCLDAIVQAWGVDVTFVSFTLTPLSQSL